MDTYVGSGHGYRRGSGDDIVTYRQMVRINRHNIDDMASKHFPPCARRTLRLLRQEHHLKYQARLQLVSFLRNAGVEVSVDDAAAEQRHRPRCIPFSPCV